MSNSITHETRWIRTGAVNWGEQEVETGYAARVPVHPRDCDVAMHPTLAKEVQYLAGIAALARYGRLKLFTSSELRSERLSHSIGTYSGHGFFDYSMLEGIPIPSIDEPPVSLVAGSQKRRLDARSDEPFNTLRSVLGRSRDQDAAHVHTAHQHEMYCFLTLDFDLIRRLRKPENASRIPPLNSKVLCPSEFCEAFGILPIFTDMMSYEGRHVPVFVDESIGERARYPQTPRR